MWFHGDPRGTGLAKREISKFADKTHRGNVKIFRLLPTPKREDKRDAKKKLTKAMSDTLSQREGTFLTDIPGNEVFGLDLVRLIGIENG